MTSGCSVTYIGDFGRHCLGSSTWAYSFRGYFVVSTDTPLLPGPLPIHSYVTFSLFVLCLGPSGTLSTLVVPYHQCSKLVNAVTFCLCSPPFTLVEMVISFCVHIHRSGSDHRLSCGVSSQKKPHFDEQGYRQASREHVVPPKKRKAPHVRRSKRATSPVVLNDEDWAMLER